MAKKEKEYWIGKGVLKVGAGKFLEYGDEVPGTVDEKTVADLKARKLVGLPKELKAIPTVVEELERLRKENADMTATLEAMGPKPKGGK